MNQIEVKLVCSDPEKGEIVLGSSIVDVSSIQEHTAQELWVPVVPARPSGPPGGQRSPRLNKDATGNQLKEDIGELHVVVYMSRKSDLSVMANKLASKEYVSVLSMVGKAPFDLALKVCSNTPQNLGDKLTAALVTIMHHQKVVLPFINAIIEKEVSITMSSSVLFRANSMAIRVLSAFGRLVGSSYLQAILGELLRSVCQDETSYEPDPQIAGPEKAAANGEYIAKLSERFLSTILSSKDKLPKSLLVACSDVRRIVGGKFQDFWPRAVGGFFFLRFVCPVIASPSTTGVIDFIPGKNARRTLILVTKVLQNIANQTAFNEPWMSKAEECVRSHIPLVERFLHSISEPVEGFNAAADVGSTPPDASAVVSAVGDLKEVVVGVSDLEFPAFLENLAATSRSNKPHNHSNYSAQLTSAGGAVFETQSSSVPWDPLTQPKVLMNGTTCLKTLPLDSEHTALDLVNMATQLLKVQLEKEAEQGLFEEGVFVDWTAFRSNPKFHVFEHSLSDLHHVRPDTLPLDAKLPFWINVFNVINFHLHVATDGKPGKASAESYYAIGGHFFTCDEVCYGILRGNTVKGRGMRKNLFFKPDDPRRAFVVSLDSKVNFCIVTFSWDSPVLRPYERDPALIRKAASVYCEKFLQTDFIKMEVVIPKILDDNKADWTEEDTLQRVLQLVQFVNARKLDILQTLTNPKCNITVSKNKGPAHPIYWLGQMRTEAKEMEKMKLLAVSAPQPKRLTLNREEAAALSGIVNQASPRMPLERKPTAEVLGAGSTGEPSASLQSSSSSLSSSSGWQRAQRNSPPLAGSQTDFKLTKLLVNREPRTRQQSQVPVESSDAADLKARRSPRSPRVGLKTVFTEQQQQQQRNSGWEDPSSPRSTGDATPAVAASPSQNSPRNSNPLDSESDSPPSSGSARSSSPAPTSGSSSPHQPGGPVVPPKPQIQLTQRPKKTSPSENSPRSTVQEDPTAACQGLVAEIKSHLDNILVDAACIVEFDVALKTGKVLMNCRKSLMAFLGWTEMPTTEGQVVPVVTLTRLQQRFIPEQKQGVYMKLVQAFHATVLDLSQIFDEIMFIAPGNEAELQRWKQREAELTNLLKTLSSSLSEMRHVLEQSRSKETEYSQVMDLSDMLMVQVTAIVGLLAKWASVAEKKDADSSFALLRLARARWILESADDVSVERELAPLAQEEAQPVSTWLTQRLGAVSDVLKGTAASSRALVLLATKLNRMRKDLEQQK